jgi:hypothetical protein
LAGCQVGGGTNRDGSVPLDGRATVRCETTVDSDSDGIFDEFETGADFDRDGIPNYLDPDSDGDGFTDREEHRVSQGCSASDLDGDGNFDFLDLDADGDGLSEVEERDRYFTDPFNPDTDADGFTDLAEVATGRDPADASSRIPEEAFYVVLPYNGAAVERELVFGTTVRKADVFFMMDRTGSMTGEAAQLRSGLSSIVTQMAESIRDIGVGFGGFAGFGGRAAGRQCETVPGFGEICTDGEGNASDTPFHLYSVITTDRAQMVRDVGALQADQGGATWASSNEALFQAATGDGILPWVGPQSCVSVPDEVGRRYGYPCFRPGALPIMVVLTDTSSKNGPLTSGVPGGNYDPADFTMGPPPHTYAETLSALQRIGARVIGVLSGTEVTNPTPRAQFETWARETGTVNASGAPILFEINSNGTGLDSSIVAAIRTLAEETPQDISTTVRDGADRPDDIGPVNAAMFIKAITPVSLFDGAVAHPCPDATRCDDARFFDVTPGGRVTFRVRFLNDFREPRSHAQVFLATIVVLGNGVAELDQREVIIVVPAGSVPFLE